MKVSSTTPAVLLAWHLYCPWSYLVVVEIVNTPFLLTVPVDCVGFSHLIIGRGYPVAVHLRMIVSVRFTATTVLLVVVIHGGSKGRRVTC